MFLSRSVNVSFFFLRIFSPLIDTVCVRLFKPMILFSTIICLEKDDFEREYHHRIY
jgi:hypothetical protein